MKKFLKRLIVIILIFLTISNFLIVNVSHAGVLETIGEGLVGIFAYPIQLLLLWGGAAINGVTKGVAYLDGATGGGTPAEGTLTPFDILFGTPKIVDINFFDMSNPESITGKIRSGVAAWYYVLRLIATAILLVILIYVGIRMAISTIASDKAMYKKMIVDWVSSLALIFLLHYIIVFTFNVNSALVDAIKGAAESTSGESMSEVFDDLQETGYKFGVSGIGAAAVFFILVTQTIGLLISYVNRMLKVAFLLIIAPLITITYSIDKMGDGKAQALGLWLKEFIFTILMQPFHCIIYLVMVSTAMNLLTENSGDLAYAILAIICVRFIQEAEKIVRKIFHFEDDNSNTSVAAGMAMSAMALSQSKNIGKALKSGATSAKNLYKGAGNLVQHAATDAMVMKSILTGNNTKTVYRESVDDSGNTVREAVGTEKMSYAEMKEEALAKQVEKKADRLGKKVYGRYAGDVAYTADYNKNKGREDLSEDDKRRYDALRGSGMGHTRAMATMRKEKLDKEKKAKDAREHPTITKNITRARGFATKVNSIRQSDTFKDLGKIASTYVAASAGAATGLALYGNGRDFMQSAMTGVAAYSGTKEFMKDTTKTLVQSATDSVSALRASNPEEARAELTRTLYQPEENFQKDSEVISEILDNLKSQLRALGMDEKTASTFSNSIHNDLRKNALEGNPQSVSDIMTKNIREYNQSSRGKINPINESKNMDGLKSAMLQTSDWENGKIIFDNFQKANQTTGVSASDYIDQVVGNYTTRYNSGFRPGNSDFDGDRELTQEQQEQIRTTNDEIDVNDNVSEAYLGIYENEDANDETVSSDFVQSVVGEQQTDSTNPSADEINRKVQEQVADIKSQDSDKFRQDLENKLKEELSKIQSGNRAEIDQLKAQIDADIKRIKEELKRTEKPDRSYSDIELRNRVKSAMQLQYAEQTKKYMRIRQYRA